ncbi:hypothetical protein TPHA_0A05540 [Tetrapisispora phaffii CBS 4417]|uniref:Uncharacterized protein n=1 Tax=Tetrapisispora phaffii (strain ATCC 24235 / CBS 4417 / NBRC 1672 / NRRL Y-8282 / UCD 70-5) TaxID=1071381 RepID=G8BP00_TETPH|nr:hypothetical protein TPHA_0A05540 [Tetrapisispora phaffii CBS 4417]CCE61628.1 hypothetical protein TPHA_0A05540 [Tetrapisispora phaffii CBS 4417]
MESLINRANSGGFFHSNTKIEHWEYQWYTPVKVNGNDNTGEASLNNFYSNIIQVANDEESINNDQVEKYSFRYKKWTRVETPQQKVNENVKSENEELDVLNLALYDRTRKHDEGSKNGKTTNGSLTVDDIRDAVGGSDSIAGLSKGEAPGTESMKDNAVNIKKTVETETSKAEEISTNTENNESVADTPSLIDSPMEETPIIETPKETESSVAETPLTTEDAEKTNQSTPSPEDDDGDINMADAT